MSTQALFSDYLCINEFFIDLFPEHGNFFCKCLIFKPLAFAIHNRNIMDVVTTFQSLSYNVDPIILLQLAADMLCYDKHYSTSTERRPASENCIIDNTHCIAFSF